jgi:hypothetical protein
MSVFQPDHAPGDAVKVALHTGSGRRLVVAVLTRIAVSPRSSLLSDVTLLPLAFPGGAVMISGLPRGAVFELWCARNGCCGHGARTRPLITRELVGVGANASRADALAKYEAYADPRVAEMAQYSRGGMKTRARFYKYDAPV